MKKVVWVLGAGFSAGLGGPLLKNLFTEGSRLLVRDYFNGFARLQEKVASIAHGVYRIGCQKLLWSNPEDYLEWLDTASLRGNGSEHWRFAERLIKQSQDPHDYRPLPPELSPGLVANAARRLLAAECSAFLVGGDPSFERWTPYVTWVTKLSAGPTQDTIITFNYDRVLEMIRGHLGVSRAAGVIRILAQSEVLSRTPPVVDVLKLHGSIDWRAVSESQFTFSEEPFFALDAEDDQLVIATPGPKKAMTVKGLGGLWGMAEQAIKCANAIVFVGYRFPPTDAEARTRLLAAIRQNSERDLQIEVVLGPNVHDPDPARLRALLAASTKATVTVHPLWAEDFLGVYQPEEFLRSPGRFGVGIA